MTPDDEIQRAHQRVVVYFNPADDIVIRSDASAEVDEEDQVIVLSRHAAMRLAARIREMLAESE